MRIINTKTLAFYDESAERKCHHCLQYYKINNKSDSVPNKSNYIGRCTNNETKYSV